MEDMYATFVPPPVFIATGVGIVSNFDITIGIGIMLLNALAIAI